MTPSESFVTYWWFHIPNLLMAAMIYTLIGRYILELVFGSDSKAVIVAVFRSVTNPFMKLIRWITPALAPDGLVVVFAIVWLIAGRMFWFLTAVAAGMRPTAGV